MNYVILSLKHSTKKQPSFWRADDCGYTINPFAAGHYSEIQVFCDIDYYNNGIDTLAIPLTDAGLESIGFQYSIDNKKVLELANAVEKAGKPKHTTT